jgi:hypothetical protein
MGERKRKILRNSQRTKGEKYVKRQRRKREKDIEN